MAWRECAIVDDNKFDRFICNRILDRILPDVTKSEFQTGSEILRYIHSGAEEGRLLILLDLNMPEMNGHEFLEALAELDREISGQLDVVIVTSSSLKEDRDRASANPYVRAYISKPILLQKMASTFARILKEH